MNTTKWIPLTMAGAFAVAMVGVPVTASAKPPCKPGAVYSPPVAQYLDHWCYPGLNTYHANPKNPNNPKSQAQLPRGHKFKQIHRRKMQVIVPR